MTYALICRDKPGMVETRKANRAQHLEYIDMTGCVSLAGPFLNDGEMCGSLVVLDLETYEQAAEWAANDPYAQAGLFEDVQIMEWKRVVG